jgi:hypothetical protein
MLSGIDAESGQRTTIVPSSSSCTPHLVPIVVRATATPQDGGAAMVVTASIDVSDDADVDGVVAVAKASATSLDFTLLDRFQG